MLVRYESTCVSTCESQYRCARTVRGNHRVLVLTFQPDLRQRLCALAAYARPEDSSVPISHLAVQVLAFQMCTTAPRCK